MGRLLIQFAGTNTTKALSETLSKNVIIVDEDLHKLRLHDGVTPGGHVIGGGVGNIDNITITANADDEIQTVAMIDQNSGIDKIWTGESADYEDIANPSNDTFYAITDDIGDSALDIGQITETLNDKVDKGHEVIAFQAPTVINGYTWYRLYADGWVEQGGIITNPAETNYTIPIEMADTNYTVFITDRTQARVSSNAGTPTSTTQFYLSTNGTGSSYSKNWEVKGMAA